MPVDRARSQTRLSRPDQRTPARGSRREGPIRALKRCLAQQSARALAVAAHTSNCAGRLQSDARRSDRRHMRPAPAGFAPHSLERPPISRDVEEPEGRELASAHNRRTPQPTAARKYTKDAIKEWQPPALPRGRRELPNSHRMYAQGRTRRLSASGGAHAARRWRRASSGSARRLRWKAVASRTM